jgi:hypothetical protein
MGFLDYDVEIHKIICLDQRDLSHSAATTEATMRARGHSPTEQATLPCRYLTRSLYRPDVARHAGSPVHLVQCLIIDFPLAGG